MVLVRGSHEREACQEPISWKLKKGGAAAMGKEHRMRGMYGENEHTVLEERDKHGIYPNQDFFGFN